MRTLISGAHVTLTGAIEAPGLAKLGEALLADVAAMIKAVTAGEADTGKAADARLTAMRSGLGLGEDGIAPFAIAKMTAVESGERDSLHRLVMDLHKALNRLAAQCAEEVVAGAHAHGLLPEDKRAVEAFMKGLKRTRDLKFNHPGLDTIAMRTGSHLVIQNDIGTTDAHVLLVGIEKLVVTITHTDVHEARAKFFVDQLNKFPVSWKGLQPRKAEGLAEGEPFYLVSGRYEAPNLDERDAFLEAIGAALVFLIDWNKARKALRKLVGNKDAIKVLDWGARHDVGHRAFLEFGGAELVASTVRHTTPVRIGYGEALGEVSGRKGAVDFLRTALRLSTDALRQGRSLRSVREALEADLVRRVERLDSALLTTVVRQIGLARDIAAGVGVVLANGQRGAVAAGTANADRAARIEKKADAIAVDARNAVLRDQANATVERMVDSAETAIDELEQAAFFASLVPAKIEPGVLESLTELYGAAISGTEAAVRGLEAAAGLAEGDGADTDDALAATDRLEDLEHAADRAERAVETLVLRCDPNVRSALPVLELARALERATDHLSALGHNLHTHVMADLSS